MKLAKQFGTFEQSKSEPFWILFMESWDSPFLDQTKMLSGFKLFMIYILLVKHSYP